MRRIAVAVTIAALSALTLGSCSKQPLASAQARPKDHPATVFVSIPPQAYFVERVGGDNVDVQVLVTPGQSPATYEPSPAQMAALADASVYFRIGVPFEKAFIPRIRAAAPSLLIRDGTLSAPHLRAMEAGTHEDHEHDGAMDPHIWLDPANAIALTRDVLSWLVMSDPANAGFYERNAAAFIADLEALETRLRERLKPFAGSEILVFHPSFGYFTDAYGLRQAAIEVEGKEPGPRQLQQIIDDARARRTRVIFVQPQFSSHSAEAIAREIGAAVVPIDPLAQDYIANMEHIADSITAAMN